MGGVVDRSEAYTILGVFQFLDHEQRLLGTCEYLTLTYAVICLELSHPWEPRS